MSAAEELHNRGVRIEELRAEITHLKYERQEIIDNALAEKAELVAALTESLALNENFVSVSEAETLSHLSEHEAVIRQARAALAAAGHAP